MATIKNGPKRKFLFAKLFGLVVFLVIFAFYWFVPDLSPLITLSPLFIYIIYLSGVYWVESEGHVGFIFIFWRLLLLVITALYFYITGIIIFIDLALGGNSAALMMFPVWFLIILALINMHIMGGIMRIFKVSKKEDSMPRDM